jgi:hypothetical protein
MLEVGLQLNLTSAKVHQETSTIPFSKNNFSHPSKSITQQQLSLAHIAQNNITEVGLQLHLTSAKV